METLATCGAVVACVLLFSFAIFIHEFGHFIVARRLGLRVDAFSIGFGPVLWKTKHGGVEYRISAIPFGGYVSLPQLDPAGTKALEGAAGAAAPQVWIPAWKRIAVAFAGPFGNIVLAVALAVALAAAPGAKFGEIPAELTDVPPGGPAAKAGLLPGDRVVAVNGHPVRTWSEMQTEVQIAAGTRAEFAVERAGERLSFGVTPVRDAASGAWYIMAVHVPKDGAKAAAWMPARNPLKQLAWDAGNIMRILKALVTPGEAKSAAQALGGPVMIAEGLYTQVRRNAWDAMGFLRFLDVNLAILNLLPIPVLDGGLILFALFELLFRRRPPKKLTDGLSTVFMWLFLALMLTLVWRDVARSRRVRRAAAEQEATESARAAEDARARGFKPAFDLGK